MSVEELKETVRKADAAKPTPIPEAVKLKQRVEKVEPKAHSGVSRSARKDNSPVRVCKIFLNLKHRYTYYYSPSR